MEQTPRGEADVVLPIPPVAEGVSAVEAEALPPPPPPPSVRVKVKFSSDIWGGAEIECLVNGEKVRLPTTTSVVARLSAVHKKVVKELWKSPGRIYLTEVIRKTKDSISAAEWANYIGETLVANLTSPIDGNYEVQSAIPNSAYLSVGNQLYKLIPTAIVKTNGALAATRARLREEMSRERETVLRDAQMTANNLIEEANRLRATAQQELTAQRRSTPPPTWIQEGGYTCRYSGGNWEVLVRFGCKLYVIDYTYSHPGEDRVRHRNWTPLVDTSVQMSVWIPIFADGIFSATSFKTMEGTPVHPHIKGSSGCMDLGITLDHIRSSTDFRVVYSALRDALQGVQLNSLLASYDEWPEFHKFLPEPVRDKMRRGGIVELRTWCIQMDREEANAQQTAVNPTVEDLLDTPPTPVSDEWTVLPVTA